MDSMLEGSKIQQENYYKHLYSLSFIQLKDRLSELRNFITKDKMISKYFYEREITDIMNLKRYERGLKIERLNKGE